MKNQLSLSLVLPPTWLRGLIIILLVLGVFFRFVNLDRKVYWTDETYTSLRLVGYQIGQVSQYIFDGKTIGIDDLQKYQILDSEKGLRDTIRVLAVEDSQHPPLYYIMTRWWVQCWGDSIMVTRSISALLSLLAFPCIYWLCLELFRTPLVGWISVALIAVSPLHILYAQEAREYGWWTVTILLSSAAFLSATRLGTKLSWSLYTLTLIIGLYTFPFTALVAIGHGFCLLVNEGFKLSQTFKKYVLASLVGLVAFSPWLWVSVIGITNISNSTSWTSESIPILSLVKIWILNLTRAFLDVEFDISNPLTYLILPIVILVGYSIYYLCRTSPQRVWLFLLLLIGLTAAVLVLPDLILGGRRSTPPRLLMPTYLGIQIAVAYLFADQISKGSLSNRGQKIWSIMMVLILTIGIISDLNYLQAKTWWNKYKSNDNFEITKIINNTNKPLIISDNYSVGDALSLSYYLDPKVKLQFMRTPQLPRKINGYSDVFVFNPSKELVKTLQEKYNILSTYNNQFKLLKLADKSL
ncbi:MAG: hypothetical protein F6K58_13610 [Symploca sp. SIO2E9]|nr:hypothetical protein [Symploca sp. SIO2E9]